MTHQEIDDLFEEFEAIMIRKFPPEEYGEDSECDVLMYIAETLRNEAKSQTKITDYKNRLKAVLSNEREYKNTYHTRRFYNLIDKV